MLGFLEAGKQAFESYKKDIIAAILFSLVDILIKALIIIPIIGAIIGAYLTPRVLGWYYDKTIGNIKPNYKLAFKAWLIYLLVINIAILLAFGPLVVRLFHEPDLFTALHSTEFPSSLLIEILYRILAVILVILIIALIMYYSLYATVLGKINEMKIDVKKSLILLLYFLGWGIILSILIGIIELIPFIGEIINLLASTFFYGPMMNLIMAHKVLSM